MATAAAASGPTFQPPTRATTARAHGPTGGTTPGVEQATTATGATGRATSSSGGSATSATAGTAATSTQGGGGHAPSTSASSPRHTCQHRSGHAGVGQYNPGVGPEYHSSAVCVSSSSGKASTASTAASTAPTGRPAAGACTASSKGAPSSAGPCTGASVRRRTGSCKAAQHQGAGGESAHARPPPASMGHGPTGRAMGQLSGPRHGARSAHGRRHPVGRRRDVPDWSCQPSRPRRFSCASCN